MDPQKDNTLPAQNKDKKPMNDFPEEDTAKLSLSEEPEKAVHVVKGDETATPSEPPKPPTSSESYSPLGAITPPSAAHESPAAPGVSRKKKLGLIGLIVGIVVVLLGASAGAYFGYYLPNQPENILKSALVNSFSKDKANSVHFNGKASVTDTASDTTYSAEFTGASSQTQFDLSVKIDALVTTVTFDMRSLDGKSFFLRLGGLDGLPELLAQTGDPVVESYGPVLMAINDQWYEINESLIEEWLGTSLESGVLTEADIKKLGQAYEQHQFLVVKETLASESINGRDSYHYKVVVDKDKLKKFVAALKDAKLDSIKLTQKNVDDFSNMLMGVNFSKYPIDVWIDKDSKMFTQLGFKVEEDGAVFDAKVTITDYNKPVTVEKPEGAKSILEAMNDIFEAMGLPAGLGSDVPDNMLQGLEAEGVSL